MRAPLLPLALLVAAMASGCVGSVGDVAGSDGATARDGAAPKVAITPDVTGPVDAAEVIDVAYVPGAVDPDMLRIKAVEVQVALLPLLSSRVEVRSVTIVDPVVTIETTKDGKSSLDFPPAKPGAAGTTPMDIALENVSQ